MLIKFAQRKEVKQQRSQQWLRAEDQTQAAAVLLLVPFVSHSPAALVKYG